MTTTHLPIDRSLSTPAPNRARSVSRLRAVFAVNASTSAAGGLATALFPGTFADWFGVSEPAVLRVVGIGLVVFATAVAWAARQPVHRLAPAALAVSVADISWVAASVVVLLAVDLSGAGQLVVALVALAVADFAIAQLWLRRSLR